MAAAAPDPQSRVPRALVVQWHVTERCNLHCRHCYQGEQPSDEMDFAGLLAVIEQIRDLVHHWGRLAPGHLRRCHLNLTGGEPFVRADFLDLLERLVADPIPFTFGILSNGTRLEAAVAQRLKQLGTAFVQVSLEGGPATHDAIRGPGSHAAALAGLRHLRRAGVQTLVSFTAHRGNWREFPAVARTAARLGVQRVWSDRLIPVGRGAGEDTGVLTPEETREWCQLMAATRRRYARGWWRTEVELYRALQFTVGGGRPYHCNAGNGLLTIMPNGDLLPCRRLPEVVGNVLRTPLPELYEGAELLQTLRDPARRPDECVGCAWVEGCRGGLRCLAQAVHGDPFTVDPGCWLADAAD